MRFRQRQASVHTPPASDFTDNSGGKVQQASKRVAEEALASPRRRKREGAVDLYAQQHRPTDALPPCHDDNQKHWQHHSKWPPKEQPAESPILRASYTPRASAAAAVMSRQRQQQQQMGRGNVVIYGSSYRGGRGWSCPSNSSTNPEAANNSFAHAKVLGRALGADRVTPEARRVSSRPGQLVIKPWEIAAKDSPTAVDFA
ncbi:hypothetical protein MRX96_039325 [Rhipicephalus microplus]